MNCKICKKELEAYHEGRLPEGIKFQVAAHLANCKDCTNDLLLISLSEKVIEAEKKIQSNPFLSTRIIASIEAMENKKVHVQHTPAYLKMLKPVLIGISLAVAIIIGAFVGNIYKPSNDYKSTPIEMAYIDDAALESINMFSNE